MEPVLHEKLFSNQKHFSTDNFNNHLLSKYKIKESENKLHDEHYEKICEFLSSKFKAMEKINLEDEFLVEDENEVKKVNIDKKMLQKSEHPKNKKDSNSLKKKTIKKNRSRKNMKSKSNTKNIVINYDGKIEKPKKQRIDFVNIKNLDLDKEIKGKELDKFFSNKTLLNSIINEIKEF